MCSWSRSPFGLKDNAPWTSWMFSFGGFTHFQHSHKQGYFFLSLVATFKNSFTWREILQKLLRNHRHELYRSSFDNSTGYTILLIPLTVKITWLVETWTLSDHNHNNNNNAGCSRRKSRNTGASPFLLFYDKCPGFFYVHYITHRTYSFTSHPKDEAIMVKCLAQGHKCRDRPGRDSNPHSGNTRTWVQCTRPLGHDTPQGWLWTCPWLSPLGTMSITPPPPSFFILWYRPCDTLLFPTQRTFWLQRQCFQTMAPMYISWWLVFQISLHSWCVSLHLTVMRFLLW